MRADYGQDAPGLLRGFLAVGLILLTTGAILILGLGPGWWRMVGMGLAFASLYPLGMAVLMVLGSRVGKLRERDRVLDAVDWGRVRSVVDLGCGRGLMTIGAVRRMTDGIVTGVDIWSNADQSGNGAEAAMRNAVIEGVADKVRFVTADMRHLPMADGSVDLIVSAWAIHNLPTAQDRGQALVEAARVLTPGGQMMLTDIAGLPEYAAVLAGLGFTTQRLTGPLWWARFRWAVSFGTFSPATLIARWV